MSARDELAGILWTEELADWRLGPEEAAEAILAAGYSKPRTITTAEELDDVALLTVIRSAGGVVYEWYAGCWQETGIRGVRTSDDVDLPATVLYDPSAA